MLRIALTGGIATGKSHVLGRLAASGIPTVDADQLVHQALNPGSPVVPLVQSRFGPGVLAADGGIDHQALAAIVFSDAGARQELEAILHPHVYHLIDEWFASFNTNSPKVRKSESPRVDEQPPGDVVGQGFSRAGDARRKRPSFAVADIPLLYETGHERFFDRVIVTACPRMLQVSRLKARSGLTDAQAQARLDAQWPIEEKVGRADYVIDTSGTFEETDRQVDEVVGRLRAEG